MNLTKEQILEEELSEDILEIIEQKDKPEELRYFKRYILDAMERYAQQQVKNLNIPAVVNWVAVTDRLPEEKKFRMSADVLTIAGDKMSVKCYDYELMRWSGSPHITVKYWMPLPEPPCL